MSEITIDVDEETKRRLDELSSGAGVTVSHFIREMIDSYLEDTEDIREAETALREAETEGFIPWEQIKASHGL